MMYDFRAKDPSMSHLPTERLAALADEAPTPAELAHLASCAECARERAAYQSVADLAAADSARIGAPLTTWDALRPALVADGIIDDGRGLERSSRRAQPVQRPWMQAAAAILLIAGGVVAGRYSAGAPPFPGATVAQATATVDSAPTFNSIEDAVAAQSRAQAVYQSAVAFLAQHDSSSQPVESPAAIRERLAALDQTGRVLSEAREKAPYDPVINGYYFTTMGQREATIRQLNTVLPASMRIQSF